MLLVVISLCWGTFIGVWAIGAIYNARYAPTTVRRDIGFKPWQGWILAAMGGIALQIVVPASAWAANTFRTEWLSTVGVVLLIGATLFTLWARWTLGKMWSSVPALREHHELRTDGPYRFTRHPIYTGILGMLLGSALVAGFGGLLVALVVASAVFLVRIPREEKLMLETFGNDYERYRHEVPRLVPFLHI